MTSEEAFEKWWEKGGGGVCGKQSAQDAFLAGVQHQENQQLLCLVQIREALGDKDAKLSQEELVERVKGLARLEGAFKLSKSGMLDDCFLEFDATTIYNSWEGVKEGWVPWVRFGNSEMQFKARQEAKRNHDRMEEGV